MRAAGFSLVETLLGLALTSLILLVAFGAFVVGSQSWRSSDVRGDMVRGTRLLATDLTREVQRSVYASLSTGPDGCAFLSAVGVNGHFTFDAQGNPDWQSYLVYYRSPQRQVFRREVPATGTVQPIGQPLTDLMSGGRLLLGHVEAFELHGRDNLSLAYRIYCTDVQGREALRFTLQGSCSFRNR